MGVRLFVGGYSSYIQGERFDLGGDLEFSAAHCARSPVQCAAVTAFLDSGAFTDAGTKTRLPVRLAPEEALRRQLDWERRTADLSGAPGWQARYLVSYDRLIDETWVGGQKLKRRWSLRDADLACAQTVEAARFLAAQRREVAPRTLVLSAQGVDALQYRECAREVLAVTQPGDWFGFGGWCIIGRNRRWLPEFWRTLQLVLPMVRAAGVTHAHLFGVLWLPALGGFLHLADQHGLTVSTDSGKPVQDCTWSDPKKAGVRVADWRGNVRWWQETLRDLRTSEYYLEPRRLGPLRQTTMEGLWA
jgi:hypothetical protein